MRGYLGGEAMRRLIDPGEWREEVFGVRRVSDVTMGER